MPVTLALVDSSIEPAVKDFTALIGIILIFPIFSRKLKLPGIVGMLVGGFIAKEIDLLSPHSPNVKALATIGKNYLMFIAGMETDLSQFKESARRAILYGLATFSFPMIAGIIVGVTFGYTVNGAIFIGSLLASHTLLAYPMCSKLGILKDESVVISVGATIITGVASLFILAVCVGVQTGDFNIWKVLILLLLTIALALVTFYGLNIVGEWLFKKLEANNYADTEVMVTLFTIFGCALAAQAIGLESIVGAFFAGLGINPVLHKRQEVGRMVIVVGHELFIPFFFVNLGLLLDHTAFGKIFSDGKELGLAISYIGGLIVSKAIAAGIVTYFFKYTGNQFVLMWSLSLPQVAATLAAAMVGYEKGLIGENLYNDTILLMLVTSTLGPVISQGSAARMAASMKKSDIEKPDNENDRRLNFGVDIYRLNDADANLKSALDAATEEGEVGNEKGAAGILSALKPLRKGHRHSFAQDLDQAGNIQEPHHQQSSEA